MKTCAGYVAELKAALQLKADADLGKQLKFSQQSIAAAKSGQMSDNIALAIGERLFKLQLIEHPGEVMLVAHAERTSGRKRTVLMDYAKNVLAAVSATAAKVAVALAVCLSTLSPNEAFARASGGVERSRRRHRY